MALRFSSPPEISIIIVAYNQCEFTKKCVQSLNKNLSLNYEIILIDNASTDDTYNTFTQEIQYVRYFRNQENLGFPVAANQGISQALGNYILLLNNDTIIPKNSIERLLEVAKSNDNIGIVGPISNEVSGLQKDKEANYNTIEEMFLYASEIGKRNNNQLLYFPRIAFLCALIKKEVVDKIGGLDERFSPGNYEDDDFCLRAQLAGFKTVIAKDAFVHHFGSKSFKATGEKAYTERLMKNQKIFIEKWNATPEEIWLQNKQIKPHQIFYSIDKNIFLQHFKRVRIHLLDNEIHLAQIEIQKAIENYQPGDGSIISKIDLYNMAGNIFLATNNLDEAQYYFEEELNLSPTSSNACLGLGKVFFARNQFDAAKTMIEWAVKNDPFNQNAISALSEISSLLGIENKTTVQGIPK